MNPEKLYIDGTWIQPASGTRDEVVDSASESVIGSFPLGNQTDVDRAVQAATGALNDRDGWAGFGPARRAEVMRRFADAIEQRREALGMLISQEVGTPLGRAIGSNADAAAALLRFYAKVIEDTPVEDLRPAGVGFSVVRREPIGVVGMIAPWNYPLSTLFFKLAPALAAGCTAVVKPASNTALNSFLIAEAAQEAGLPDGVLNIVPCDRTTGEYLVSHPGVHKVAFTGSTPVGRRIGQLCGQGLKPVTLELGGKSAALLLEDASLEKLAEHLHDLSFANNGQTCTNNTRLIVPAKIYDDVVTAVTDTVRAWPVGDPGTPRDRDRPGGEPEPQRFDREILFDSESRRRTSDPGGNMRSGIGFYVEPTVFADVTPDMTVFREELFGPAVSITRVQRRLRRGRPHRQ